MKVCVDCPAHVRPGRATKRCQACHDNVALRKRQNYLENRAARLQWCREYRLKNAEAIRIRRAAKYVANRDAEREKRRAWYRANEALVKAKAAAWLRAHPEYGRAARQKRRAEGDMSVALLRAVRDVCDGTCAYCLGPASTVDHVLPVSRGGDNAMCNLVLACRSCNSRKHSKTPLEFVFDLPRLGVH